MPPYEELPSFEELLKRAEATANGFSRSYVEDAVLFARWIRREGRLLSENLISTQQRCTELIEEAQKLQARVAELEGDEVYKATSSRG